VEIAEPSATPEKFALYRRYLDGQHDGAMSRTYESFVEFLYDTPPWTQEFRYQLGGRLAGVSLADRCPGGLSSVYMFFDPALGERSLGTYSILWEIEHCRGEGLPYYYLGYYVAGSESMSYKARFRPNELLAGVGTWQSFAK
jgi:arginine-tRNA-protein transferase